MSNETPDAQQIPMTSKEIFNLMAKGAFWAGLVLVGCGVFIYALYLISQVLPTG